MQNMQSIQNLQTKPAKPNLPNQIKLSLPNILNQTYQTKISGQRSQRRVRSAFGNVSFVGFFVKSKHLAKTKYKWANFTHSTQTNTQAEKTNKHKTWTLYRKGEKRKHSEKLDYRTTVLISGRQVDKDSLTFEYEI